MIVTAVALIALAGLYFYDRAENAPTQTRAEKSAVRAGTDPSKALIGLWRSNEDAKFTREFMNGGESVDRYEGDETATVRGQWSVFTGSHPDALYKGELDRGKHYLKIQDQYEVLLFSIDTINDSDLVLTYLDRGNTLRFTRVR